MTSTSWDPWNDEEVVNNTPIAPPVQTERPPKSRPNSNAALWEEANKQAPVPQVKIAAPALAQRTMYKPEVKLLRRESPSNSSTNLNALQQKSKRELEEERKEKERRYAEARERILGSGSRNSSPAPMRPTSGASGASGASGTGGTPVSREAPREQNGVLRRPEGPDSGRGGFRGRGRGWRAT
ncbi:hypothetical protein YB2330_002996 [Saitoella coloradoensis]